MLQITQRILLTFLMTSLAFVISSQTDATVHLDKPYYVTGEVVWYTVFLPKAFENTQGKIKVVIQNNDQSVIDESFVQLENAKIAGYYKIPFDLPSGLYHYTFYALENKLLEPVAILGFEVPIYNDLNGSGVLPIFPQSDLMAYVPKSTNGNLKLSVTLNNDKYRYGDKVKIHATIKSGDGSVIPGDYSISVVDESLVGGALQNNVVFTKPVRLKYGVTLGIDERIFIQGKIYNTESEQAAKINIISAYNSEENKMYYSRSDQSGKFTILLPDQVGPSTLQITGNLYEEYEDTRIILEKNAAMESGLQITSEYDADVTTYLDASIKRKRIYQHFNQLENDFVTIDYTKKKSSVRPNKSFRISEYVSFETIGKFFDEILGSQLNFLKSGDQVRARMFNPESNKNAGKGDDYYFPRSPVFIVDGKMTKDARYIYNMKSDQVQTVELYFDWRDISKQFGTFGDFGYVIITTTRAEIQLPETDEEDIIRYKGLQPLIKYPVEIATTDRSFPAFRPLVYWNPSVSDKNAKGVNLEFSSSDDASIFKIVVVARAQDGTILKETLNYESAMSGQ